jgi:hypothetical protein
MQINSFLCTPKQCEDHVALAHPSTMTQHKQGSLTLAAGTGSCTGGGSGAACTKWTSP